MAKPKFIITDKTKVVHLEVGDVAKVIIPQREMWIIKTGVINGSSIIRAAPRTEPFSAKDDWVVLETRSGDVVEQSSGMMDDSEIDPLIR